MSGRTGWNEVADRVWTHRAPWLDVTSTVIAGTEGALLVDTGGSARDGRFLVESIRALGVGGVTAVLNTHWHFDHCFGNAEVARAWPHAPVLAHEEAAAQFARDGAAARKALAQPDHPDSSGHHEEVARTTLHPPETTFALVTAIDLGDRTVEALHLGAGHTSGDVVAVVPDADLVVAGDLVEESGTPCYGDDSFPLEWPRTVDRLLTLLGPGTVVVPGHGAPVGRTFVEHQYAALGAVAETIHQLAADGVPADRALEAGAWPWSQESVRHAVARGYLHLPRSARRLPLV